MRKYFLGYILIVFLFLNGCYFEKNDTHKKLINNYPAYLGDIPYNSALDDKDFQLCDSLDIIKSRSAVSYIGGYPKIEEDCRRVLEKASNNHTYSGYVLARFIINCKKESGRFRIQSLDSAFMLQPCSDALISEVKTTIESLNNWVFTHSQNQEKDHSKYLNFLFKNGQLETISH